MRHWRVKTQNKKTKTVGTYETNKTVFFTQKNPSKLNLDCLNLTKSLIDLILTPRILEMPTAPELAFLCYTVWLIFGTPGQRRRRLPHSAILMLIEYIIQSTDINKYCQKTLNRRRIINNIDNKLSTIRETLMSHTGLPTDTITENGSRKKQLPLDVVLEITKFIEFNNAQEKLFRYRIDRIRQYMTCYSDKRFIFIGCIMGMNIKLTMENDVPRKIRMLSGNENDIIVERPAVFIPSTYTMIGTCHHLQLNFDHIEMTDFNCKFFEELESIMMHQPARIQKIDNPILFIDTPLTIRLEKIIRFSRMFWSQADLNKIDLVQIIDEIEYRTSVSGYMCDQYAIIISGFRYEPKTRNVIGSFHSYINSYKVHNMDDSDYFKIAVLLKNYDDGNYKWEPHQSSADWDFIHKQRELNLSLEYP